MIFDFKDTEFMDSSGIGAIMGRYRMIQLINGEVWAVHTNARIKNINIVRNDENNADI